MKNLPKLAVTLGEPAGIGPDLLIQLLEYALDAELIVIADKAMLQQRAKLLGAKLQFKQIDIDSLQLKSNSQNKETPEKWGGVFTDAAVNQSPQIINIIDVKCAGEVVPGELNQKNADYVLETLKIATAGCIEKRFDAMVTAPLHKGIINDAGISFTGHTEFLAELTQAKLPVMMLAADSLRVALATTHLPLKAVSAAITKESLRDVLTILNDDLKTKFGIVKPHILVCGLNPHAGEGGHLGMEEIETIQPVINELRNAGFDLNGPLPADTVFTPKYLENADAVLAMFHDQGLPVLKHVGFGHAVNITLGLPIIRTSVDHGTALDLAGTGKASIGSLLAAIHLAISMVNSATT